VLFALFLDASRSCPQSRSDDLFFPFLRARAPGPSRFYISSVSFSIVDSLVSFLPYYITKSDWGNFTFLERARHPPSPSVPVWIDFSCSFLPTMRSGLCRMCPAPKSAASLEGLRRPLSCDLAFFPSCTQCDLASPPLRTVVSVPDLPWWIPFLALDRRQSSGSRVPAPPQVQSAVRLSSVFSSFLRSPPFFWREESVSLPTDPLQREPVLLDCH